MTILKVKPSETSDNTAKALSDRIDLVRENVKMVAVSSPGVGCTPTLLNEVGNLSGSLSYYVTFYTATGETARSGMTGEVVLTNQKITLSGIAISSNPKVIGRRIYRNKVNGDSVLKYLVVDINNNTDTTYVDNIADANLGVAVPQMSSGVGGEIFINGSSVFNSSGASIAVGSVPAKTGYANASFGINCFTKNTVGFRNAAFGMFALNENTNGNNNSAFGVHALNNNVSGSANCSFGYMSTQFNNGSDNSVFGTASLTINTTGSRNCAFGSNSLYQNQNGNDNVAIGYYALNSNLIGSGNVAVGANAGRYETGSYKLFIDNLARSSEADGRLKALIYGIFDAATANQLLAFNAAKIKMNYLPTSASGLEIGQLWNDGGTIKIVLT